MKKKKNTIEKMYVTCPFCAKETGRWTMANTQWKWLRLSKTWTPDSDNQMVTKRTTEFENRILQEHLDSGECLTIISPKSLELLNLQKA